MTAGQRALLGAIRAYQLTASAVIGRQCRFLPSCSDYGAEAVRRHGAWPGLWMAGARLCRCRPLGGWGYDPVPLSCEPVSAWAPWRHGVWRTRPEAATPDGGAPDPASEAQGCDPAPRRVDGRHGEDVGDPRGARPPRIEGS